MRVSEWAVPMQSDSSNGMRTLKVILFEALWFDLFCHSIFACVEGHRISMDYPARQVKVVMPVR